MKIKGTILMFFVVAFSFNVQAQAVKCDDLIHLISEDGKYMSEVTQPGIIQSSWLKSVTAYEYDGKIFAIAIIKRNDYDSIGKKYIFCNIPMKNWDSFAHSFQVTLTFGEKFHKYIIDYECNCS